MEEWLTEHRARLYKRCKELKAAKLVSIERERMSAYQKINNSWHIFLVALKFHFFQPKRLRK
jgi:hypothetical protein